MSVKDGRIHRISPSMINAFDASSRYGCERRGFFKYVLGKKEPTTPEMTRGTHLHAMNEEYLKTGKLLLGTPEQTAWFKAGLNELETLRTGLLPEYAIVGVELPMPEGFAVEGIPVSEMSKCDVVTESGIIDWKTTGSIEKNAKTPGQLAKDVQLLIYAKAFHPNAPHVKLTHGYYQVDHPVHFKPISVELSRQELDDNYGHVIIPRVERMKQVVQATNAIDVQPNRDACRRCPHSSYCPPDKENPIMGIFAGMKKPQPAPAEGIKPVVKDGVPTIPFTAILPPDAPKSDPALAAKPVEGFTAVPPPRKHAIVDVPPTEKPTAPETPAAKAEAPAPAPTPPPPGIEAPKRGRGRPPGAKNKPKSPEATENSESKDEVLTYDPAKVDSDAIKRANLAKFNSDTMTHTQFESVTVNYGLTMNLGNFNSVRIDCSMSAKFQGSPDAAFQTVLDKVKAQVEAEIQKVQQATQLNPNPAK